MAIKLVTRAQWGARAYRTPNGATPYSGPRRGVKLHYLGTAYADRVHDRCAAYIRLLQDQHMDGNGWSDIGYSFLVCTHGYVYEGRGLKRRNSANGNTALNEQDYAVCLLVGSSDLVKPTVEQMHGARDAIDYCRKEGPAGTWLGGHRDGYATSCPGDPIYAWVKAGAPRPASEEDDMPTVDEIATAVLKKDGIIAVPGASATNPTWTLSSVQTEILKRLDKANATLAAQSAAITSLAGQLGEDVDTAAVVAAVQQAIADAVVSVDVNVTSKES
ncbi:peptidoglycan recognition protein family protein [Streptomyces sp. AMCC400023]|uniref:peptidoglycan recognition protein family protein n=1 Tax=Streptomyces sp. AMCC400023 TaxID=2056258 RepID=UPI001F3CA111|nr:peptidoglycan recognition family protein [Streptomyces sp. AMCC400023]